MNASKTTSARVGVQTFSAKSKTMRPFKAIRDTPISIILGLILSLFFLWLTIVGMTFLQDQAVFHYIGRDTTGRLRAVTMDSVTQPRFIADVAIILIYYGFIYLGWTYIVFKPAMWIGEREVSWWKRKKKRKKREFEDYHNYKFDPHEDDFGRPE